MVTATPIINAFTAGELSRHLDGRTDHEKYYSGCRRLENFITRPHGSVFRRPGTRFIAPARHADRRCRLLSFDFNATASQSYVIEMGDGYLRFFADGGMVLREDGTPCEIPAPWSAAQVDAVNTVQSADVLYLVHPEVCPHTLTRRGHDDWALEPMVFHAPGWNIDVLGPDGVASDGRQGNSMSLPEGTLFEGCWLVRCAGGEDGGEWFRYLGTRQLDALDAALAVTFRDTPDKDASDQIESIRKADGTVRGDFWRRESVSHTMPKAWKDGSWPSCIGFYEDRLVLAATPEKPLTLWLSRTGAYEDFRLNTSMYDSGVQGEPLDDDAIEITLSGSRVNPIRWVMDQEHLLVGTNASEIKVWSGTDGEGMTPSRCQRKRQSAHGSASLPAQLVSGTVLYVTRTRRKVRELLFDFSSNSYRAPELTLLAEHVTGPGIADMDYAREPDGVLWCVRDDGMLIGCTYLREENVRSWHRHPLGGGGRAESVAVIPGPQGDEVWLVVRRTVAGAERRYVERLDPAFVETAGDARDAFFVDSGLTYRGEARRVICGMEHLEGETVQVLADGCVLGERMVREGRVDLGREARVVHMGLGYASVLQPMRLEMGSAGGTSQTRRKRIMGVTLRVLDSVGGSVCVGDDRPGAYEAILPHHSGERAGHAPRLDSGDRLVRLSGGFDRDGIFTVRQDEPLPMTVICCVPEVVGE
ncbi:hypothetical protein GGQ74_002204 [Desulfobaculum xiamenense]|uniref:Uncharacterized protein n=1 Tax=Desulfobaculum xiamenense TaxID=995050 RepID=A0A846QK67_9BACT|nr:hypothetical protein [Desulfobaculum xiamenense]NJB68531.1 hypothetical protein [Desulfobaculum xiamenense]